MVRSWRISGWLMAILVVLLITFTTSCDSGGNGGGVGPIILITNQWWDESDPDHRFTLESPDDERSEGAFTGEEELPQGNFSEFNDLVGFWKDGHIQFTIERPDGDVRYTGTFDEELVTRLEFTSAEGDLVIVRD